MRTTLNAVAESYLKAKTLSRGTRNEYFSTLRKWDLWARGTPIEELRRKDVREFLDWVYERAVADEGTNPGRTANKAREPAANRNLSISGQGGSATPANSRPPTKRGGYRPAITWPRQPPPCRP